MNPFAAPVYSGARNPVELWANSRVEITDLAVDLSTSTWKNVMRVVTGPLNPGDLIEVDARVRLTNNCGYTIGIGVHLHGYDYNGDRTVWWPLAPISGQNVDSVITHHLPVNTDAAYEVPDGTKGIYQQAGEPAVWPAGHRLVVALRLDAHSTAWRSGDTVDVEVGHIRVRRWAPAPAGLAGTVDALTARVAAAEDQLAMLRAAGQPPT